MGVTGPLNPDPADTPAEVGRPPGGMRRPQRGEFDSEETVFQDEALHDAALRDSVLRTPR